MTRVVIVIACLLWFGPFLRGCACAAAAEDPADALLREGRSALEDGLYDLAEKQFARYLQKVKKGSAEAEDAAVLLARALHGQKKYKEMLQLLTPARSAPCAFWRAMAYHALDQHDKCLAELRDFEAKCDDKAYLVKAERLRSKAFLRTGKIEDALAAFARIESAYADSPEALANLLDWAGTLVSQGQPERARDALSKLFGRAPDSEAGHEGRCLLGRLLVGEKRWKEAEELLSALASQGSVRGEYRADALFSLADAYQAQGRQAEATNVLHQGIQLAARDSALLQRGKLSLGRLLLRMNRLDEGVALLKSFISSDPKAPMAASMQLELAGALLDNGYPRQAADEYQQYLETFSDNAGRAKAFYGKGWALASLPVPQHAEAVMAFQKAYELFEDREEKARCLFKAGDSYFKNGQYKLACEVYEKLVKEFPESALTERSKFQMAESTARSGMPKEGERLFRACAESFTNALDAERALLRVAELQEDQEQELAALASYERLLGTFTNTALRVNALHGHGLVCYRLGRFDRAQADFQGVVQMAPDGELGEQAFYMQGWCAQMMGRDQEALSTCREFVRRFPGSKWAPDVLFWVGEHEFNHGKCEEAEKAFLGLAAKYAQNPLAEDALFRAGECAAHQNEYLRATEHFATLRKKYPSGKRLAAARYAQGDAYAELGTFADAILIFEEVIKNYPDSLLWELAWGRKGDCQFALGRSDPKRYEEAMSSYRMVAGSDKASAELKLQAQYKVGLALKRLDRSGDALEQYMKVVYGYLDSRSRDQRYVGQAADVWFVRAAFAAADILEADKRDREAINVLRRVADAGVSAAKEAQDRINKIRLKQWMLPY